MDSEGCQESINLEAGATQRYFEVTIDYLVMGNRDQKHFLHKMRPIERIKELDSFDSDN